MSILGLQPDSRPQAELGQQADALRKNFQLAPACREMPRDVQEQIYMRCLDAYRRSVSEFETVAPAVAFEQPAAQDYARDLCRRATAIVEAYSDVLEDERPTPHRNPLHTREFMRKARLASILGNVSTSPGSVGANALAIEQVIANGNLRERMTLVYKTFFPFLLELLSDPAMIDKINAKLQTLPPDSRFQIDKDLVMREKSDGSGIIDVPGFGKVIKQPPVVINLRTEGGRKNHPKPRAGDALRGPASQGVQSLSDREARAGTGFTVLRAGDLPAEDRLQWIPGKAWTYVAQGSSFAREAEALGGLPILTGPSGTTDAYLHLATYLGLGDRAADGALACAAWMVPVGDHSLHEIRVVENVYGMPYAGMPADFTNYHSPAVQGSIDRVLESRGFRNPSYYFSSDFQMQVARELAELDASLAAASDGAVVGDYRNLGESVQIQQQLHSFNLEMRQLEAMELRLDQLMGSATGVKLGAIRDRKRVLIDRYNQCMDRKIRFIQEKVRPENRVYAMSIPRVLKTGAAAFSAGSREEMNRLLHAEGFSPFADSTRPSIRANSANELGEIGHYFLATPPSERAEGHVVLKCRLNRDLEGAAIMSAPELRARGFSANEIEQGFAKLQKDYPFLQRDGLAPKDSEIVILNPHGHWTVGEWRQTADAEESDTTWYFLGDLHRSWRESVAIRHSIPAAPAREIESAALQDTSVEITVSV